MPRKPMSISAHEIISGMGVRDDIVFNIRHRVTIAEVNAGHVVLAVPSGWKVRLVNAQLQAVGGAVGTATHIDITNGTDLLAHFPAGLLTATLAPSIGTPTVVTLAAGASFATQAAGVDIKIAATGVADTMTHIDVILSYCLEKA